MATLATLEGNVAGVLGLDWDSTAPTAGDGPRLLGWANDAVVDMLRRTHCYIVCGTITLTANVADYRLPSSIIAIDDVYMTSSGANFRVRRQTTTDLINMRLYQTTTSPVQMYALNGVDMLMVFPTPIQADTLTVYYVPKPTALASPTDDPSTSTLGGIPTEYHYGLELYMMWKAGDAFDDESSQSGESYRLQYEGDPNTAPGTSRRDGFIGTMKKDVRKKGGKHQAAIILPPRGRRTYVPNPGFDIGGTY